MEQSCPCSVAKLPWLGCRPSRAGEAARIWASRMITSWTRRSRRAVQPLAPSFPFTLCPPWQGGAVHRDRWALRRARRRVPVLPGEASWEPCSFAAFLRQSFTHPSPSATALRPLYLCHWMRSPRSSSWLPVLLPQEASQAVFSPSRPELPAAALPCCTVEVRPLKATCPCVR